MNKQSGYTLVELLVSLAVGIFILMAATSTLTSFFSSYRTAQNLDILHATSDLILDDMTLEVHAADNALPIYQGLRLESSGISVVYEVEEGTLYKTNINTGKKEALSPPKVTISSLKVKDKAGNTGEKNTPSLLEIELQLRNRNQSDNTASQVKRTTISLRPDQRLDFTSTNDTEPDDETPPSSQTGTPTQFYLVDADTNQDIGVIYDDSKFSQSSLPGELNIRVDTTGESGSVLFYFDGRNLNTDNTPPYSAFGDLNGDYSSDNNQIDSGWHKITAIPYSLPNNQGTRGESLTVWFKIEKPSGGGGGSTPPPTQDPFGGIGE